MQLAFWAIGSGKVGCGAWVTHSSVLISASALSGVSGSEANDRAASRIAARRVLDRIVVERDNR
jgi:hypothetical protein